MISALSKLLLKRFQRRAPEATIQGLVGLFKETHRALEARAACSEDLVLIVRDWLFDCHIRCLFNLS